MTRSAFNICLANDEIPFGLPLKWKGTSLSMTQRRRDIPLLKAQRSLSNIENNGPIDGLFNGDKWVVETSELQDLIKEKTNQMYKRHWFARLTNNILWETREENGIPRTHFYKEEIFLSNLETALKNIDIFEENSRLILDSANPTEQLLLKLKEVSTNLLLETPTSISETQRGEEPLEVSEKTWLQAQKEEVSLAKLLIQEHLHNIWKELEPKTPTPIMEEEMTKVFEKIANIKELKQVFKDMESNKTSGPSGICREHLIQANDEILEIANDMLDGNYPDLLKNGALSPKIKTYTDSDP